MTLLAIERALSAAAKRVRRFRRVRMVADAKRSVMYEPDVRASFRALRRQGTRLARSIAALDALNDGALYRRHSC